jgi:hypothetical protein
MEFHAECNYDRVYHGHTEAAVKMSHAPTSSHKTRWLQAVIVLFLGLPILYLGSLAPVWRLLGRGGAPSVTKWYAPAFVLIEETPLRAPMLAWCDLWGCRGGVERHLRQRELRHMMDPGAMRR